MHEHVQYDGPDVPLPPAPTYGVTAATFPPDAARLGIRDLDAIAQRAYGDGYAAGSHEAQEDARGLGEALRDARQQVSEIGRRYEAERAHREAAQAQVTEMTAQHKAADANATRLAGEVLALKAERDHVPSSDSALSQVRSWLALAVRDERSGDDASRKAKAALDALDALDREGGDDD